MSDSSENRIMGWIGASLTRKVGAGLVAMAVLLLLAIGAIFRQVQQQRSDANVIYVAGRQRMLSQRIANYTLRAIRGEAQAIDELQAAADEFDRSLKGLRDGDAALGLPPAPASVRPQLDAIDEMWQPDYQNVQIVLEAAAVGGQVQALALSLGERNEALLAASEAAVTALEDANAAISTISFAQQLSISAERLARFVLAISQGQIDAAPQLAEETQRFDEILYVLLLGSDQAGSPAREQLLAVQAAWEPFSADVQALLASYEKALHASRAVVASSEPLLQASDMAARLFQQEAQGKVARMLQFLVGVAVVFMLIFGFVLWATGRAIRPLAAMAEVTRAIAKGDLSTRVDVASIDEIGVLAAAFNQMTEDLQRTTVSRDYVDNILTSMTEALIVVDSEAAIQTVNQATCHLLGYAEEELIGQPIGTIIGQDSQHSRPEDGPLSLADPGNEELIREGSSSGVERTYLAKDGRVIPVLFSSSVMRDEAGGVHGIVCVARDITERKRAEEELKTFAAKLERSNRELQDFASVASHDLQEPLRKIQAFGDRLKAKCGEALSDEGRDYLERMQNAAGRMQTLINDLLTFSRVTTQAQPFVPVDLAGMAREVVSDLEMRIEQVGGRVDVGELPTIDADPTQMRQLLQNLIGNALKFHRQEEMPVVKIRGKLLNGQERRPAGGCPVDELCQIIVEDNGIGFDEKYLDRIFTPFQRLHGRSAYEGAGIGLAICRKIAERHGGSITAKSTPGQGATFIVTLPVKQAKLRET
ncbi:MAG: ATP-binding protein [Anaerolineae bacterium]